MPSEEWWENLEEPLQRPGQMQKHEPRFGYTELCVVGPLLFLLLLLCLAGARAVEKAFLGLACAVVRPRRGREDGAPCYLGLAGLGLCLVPCYAVPCPVVAV